VSRPDVGPVRAFLDDRHVALAARLYELAQHDIAPRPAATDDAATRTEARALLDLMGRAG